MKSERPASVFTLSDHLPQLAVFALGNNPNALDGELRETESHNWHFMLSLFPAQRLKC